MITIDLREYQIASVAGLREGIRTGKKNQVLCSPTGSGKTVIAMHLLDECRSKDKRAVFVVERLSLVNQTSVMLDKFGIDHGVIQGNHWRTRPGEKIQVATAQTLRKRGWPKCDLIIVDEAHVQMRDTLDRISLRDCITIGLTATPFSKGMGKFYDGIVNVTTSNKLTEDKFLVPFKVFAASEPDMKGAKVVAGEWSDSEASERAMPIIGDCVAEYIKHANGGKFIAFGVDVAHCAEMQRQFLAAGVVCELHTYKTPDQEREDHMTEFRKPDSYIRGLISVSALSRGLDVPDVDTIIMCRPLRSSLAEFLQIIGRGLRPYPDKEFCTILDHSGNTMRFFEQMNEFFENGIHELDDGEPKPKPDIKEAKEKKPVKCPKCFSVHSPMPCCPHCGFIYPVQSVAHVAGELKEIGASMLKTHDKRQLYAELRYIANQRGWSDGALAHKFRAIAGTWPNAYKDEPPATPSLQTINKVKAMTIAFIKSKRGQEWSARKPQLV